MRRITIISIRKPKQQTLTEELQWLCQAFGLFTLRDKNKSAFRLFLELLKTSRNHQAVSSDDLAERLRLSRGTVIHHLHKLIDCGIVIIEDQRYILREEHLERLIEEIKRDMERTLKDMQQAAKEIDSWLEQMR